MANEISKIKIGNTTYNLYDTTLRESIKWPQPTRFWITSTDNGTWTAGQSKTLTGTAGYFLFGVQGDNIGRAVMMLGVWHHPATKESESQYVTMLGGYDTGSASYINKVNFLVTSGKSWKFENGSRHLVGTSGYTGLAINTIYAFWGLI